MTPSDVQSLTLHEYTAFRNYQLRWIKAQSGGE